MAFDDSAYVARAEKDIALRNGIESTPVRARGSTVHSESVPNLLIANVTDFVGCSEMVLKRKVEGLFRPFPGSNPPTPASHW